MSSRDRGRLLGSYAGARDPERAEAWADELNRMAAQAKERTPESSADREGSPVVESTWLTVSIPKLRLRVDPVTGQPCCARPGCGRWIGRVSRDGDHAYFAVNPHVWAQGDDGWWRWTGKRPNRREVSPGRLVEVMVILPAPFVCGCGARQVADAASFGIAQPYGDPRALVDV